MDHVAHRFYNLHSDDVHLGIEESIQRCEALLAMVPLSYRPSSAVVLEIDRGSVEGSHSKASQEIGSEVLKRMHVGVETARAAKPQSLQPVRVMKQCARRNETGESQASCNQRNFGGKGTASTARLQQLSRPRTALYQRLAQTKAQLEEAQMQECSFKPVVGRRPKPASHHSGPIIHRLSGVQQRIEFRKRARKVIEKEEIDHCSFWPRINFHSMYLDMGVYQPPQERLYELQRKRKERLEQARALEAKQMGLTFKPEINQKSLQIFKMRGLEMIDVADRLTQSNSVNPECKGECQARFEPKNECTFSPEISSNTNFIMSTSKFYEGCSVDFLARQQQFLERLERKKLERWQKMPAEVTFRPKIGNAEVILKYSPFANWFNESIYEKIDRLVYKDSARRRHLRQKITEAYYAQFNFQPDIDDTSRLLGRTPSIRDLHLNERGRNRKAQMAASAEARFYQSYPFHPKLLMREKNHLQEKHMEKILDRRRQFREEKARALEELRAMKELQEIKECTFKPVVNPVPPKEKEPVHIKGIGRHLELQDLAKQMRKDQEEWERKVFFSHAYEMPRRQYTIPKPFTLRTGNGRLRSQRFSPPRKPEPTLMNDNSQKPNIRTGGKSMQ